MRKEENDFAEDQIQESVVVRTQGQREEHLRNAGKQIPPHGNSGEEH